MQSISKNIHKILLISFAVSVLGFFGSTTIPSDSNFANLSILQKLIIIVFWIAFIITLILFTIGLLQKFRSLMKVQKSKKPKKKAPASSYTMNMLASSGTFLLLAGIIFRFGLFLWAGVVFGFMWADRYFDKYPRYRKQARILLTILFILLVALILVRTIVDTNKYF